MTIAVADALQVALDLMATAQQISTLVQGARDAGRETLSQEEWAAIRRASDEARADAEAAIAGILAPSKADPVAAGGGEPSNPDADPGASSEGQDPAAESEVPPAS